MTSSRLQTPIALAPPPHTQPFHVFALPSILHDMSILAAPTGILTNSYFCLKPRGLWTFGIFLFSFYMGY